MREPALSHAHPSIRSLNPYKPGKPVDEVKRQYGLQDVIKLASNENPLGPSVKTLVAMSDALDDAGRYPDGNAFYLKQALAEKHGCSAESISVGNGTNELLNMISRLFLRPEVSAVYSEHAFIVYKLAVLMCGAQAIEVPAKDYGHDLTAIASSIQSNTRLIYLANPNNPTGTYFDQGAFVAFMNKVPSDVVVVLDEAYFDYVDTRNGFDGIDYVSLYANLIVTRTLSKAYGLGGMRVGYSVSSEAMADLLNRGREPFNVNAIAQAGAVAALADQQHVAQTVALNEAGMSQLERGLTALGYRFIASAGNFITINVGDGAVCAQKLMEQGVIVRAIAEYGLPEFIRVSIGLASENQRFLAALEQCQ